MSQFQILASLVLSLLLFTTISYGQTVDPTIEPTQDPTHEPTAAATDHDNCDTSKCMSFFSNNSTWLLPVGNGCKNNINGITICTGCPDANYKCKCFLQTTNGECSITDSVNALAIW